MRIGLVRSFGVLVVAAVAGAALLVGSSAQADGSTVALHASLAGANEIPGPGDLDARGGALILIRPEQGEVCYHLRAHRIDPATAAHIHRGPAGVAGPIVIPLTPPAPTSKGCVEGVDPILIDEILGDPAGFYVNVHTGLFPAGALRGQLED